MTTNAQRISRYLEKNAAKSSARSQLGDDILTTRQQPTTEEKTMTTNAQRISRYLEKNAAKSSARKRLANLSHISAPASFFHPYVDAAQNEMLAAATGED